MSVAAMQWNPTHAHPRGTWWQLSNDRRHAQLTFIGLAIMSIISSALTVWAVLEA